jgi:hypothetical protein
VVKGLTVHSGNRKLKAAAVAVTLVSDHPDSDGEPSIRAEHLELRGFSIDGFPLEVVFSDFLNRFPTKKQLTQAFRAERDLFDTFDRCLFTAPGWRAPRGRRAAPEKAGTLCGTVVREIRWKRRVHPDAVIEGNRIRVPGLGTVFLGEVFLTSLERRFSMMRIQLDGACAGEVEVCETRNNGGTWPP